MRQLTNTEYIVGTLTCNLDLIFCESEYSWFMNGNVAVVLINLASYSVESIRQVDSIKGHL